MYFKQLTLATLVLASPLTFAQMTPAPSSPNISGTMGKPATLDLKPVLEFLLNRFHTFDVQALADQMKNDGISEKNFTAVITAEGAIVYDHELKGEDYDKEYGRNLGHQLLPFTLKLNPNGDYYLAVSPFSLKNMNTYYEGDLGYYTDPLWSVVDNMEFVVFKWDNNLSFKDIKSFSMELAKVDLKVDILGSKKESRFLAITGSGSVGFGSYSVKLENGETINIKSPGDAGKGLGFRSNYSYGLQYVDTFKKGQRLDIRASMTHGYQAGSFKDQKKIEEALLIGKEASEVNRDHILIQV
jgi:hypothetical protein